MILPEIRVRAGREKKLRNHYPWVQREEVRGLITDIEPGALVRVAQSDGTFIGIGTYSNTSRFPIRMLTLVDEPIDEEFFVRRIAASVARRDSVKGTNSMRIVFGEADRLPGLMVDQYDRWCTVQVRSMGMEALKPLWLPALQRVVQPEGIIERSDMEGRREEGLDSFVGVLAGTVPEHIAIEEHGLTYSVPSTTGLKTGFYLDQRDNRQLLRQRVRPGDRVLDLFCYSGGFSLNAAFGGADVVGIDISEEAIELAKANATRNILNCRFEVGNAFENLESGPETGYDWIILDPPAISKTKSTRDSLKWAVWKLMFHALPKLNPGGRIVVFSCSYQFGLEGMMETIRLASNDRGIPLTVEGVTLQPADHPFFLQFPESLYLKAVWLRRD
ncbi:MAG: class I SAM-dependent rRNA methyltransferase [Fimbriimonas sp.]